MSVATSNHADIARVAYDLWLSLRGAPEIDRSMEAAQKSLQFYRECFKAVAAEPFDATKIK